MGEKSKKFKKLPRKIVACPSSQFDSGSFKDWHHQSEKFRFIGNDDMPYTTKGRSRSYDETQIAELKDWKPQILAVHNFVQIDSTI